MSGDNTKHAEQVEITNAIIHLLPKFGPQELPILVLRFPRGTIRIEPSISQYLRLRKLSDVERDPEARQQ